MVAASASPARPPARFFLYLGCATLALLLLVSLHPTHPLHSFITPAARFYSSKFSSSSRPGPPYSPLLQDDSNSDLLSYRNRLEATTSIPAQAAHSQTLTFDHIYVLSLPSRLDRRDQMRKLAKALGIEVTFVDAVFKDEPWIRWVAERAQEVREERLTLMAAARGVPKANIGGLEVGNAWLTQTADQEGRVPFPRLPKVSKAYAPSWISHLLAHARAGTLNSLVPADPKLNITAALWDPVEKIAGRQVNEGVISTFFGHTKAMRLILENGDRSALILEDDVDVEWDLERLWSRMEYRLQKSGWEMALLGHCWGKELLRPAYLHPNVHASSVPLCLHAYALTQAGASHLLSLLENPWSAYQTAVDTAVPSFISFGLFNSFSVEPPLILQRKDGPSDIQAGIGSKWHGILMDSTVERLRRDEGEVVVEDVWVDGAQDDPANKWRYGTKGSCGSRVPVRPPGLD